MPDEFQFDVFLSHSAKDKAVVRPLAERLRKDGLKVWFDEWVLKAGDSIPAKIEEGLEHSRVLVLCMSAHAFGSDWAQLEAGTFRFRDPLNKERRFIPLRLDDAPIKGSLAQFLFINWLPGKQDYEKVLEGCRPRSYFDKHSLENSRPSSQQKQVILIDDDHGPMELYVQALRLAGFHVTHLYSLEEALRHIRDANVPASLYIIDMMIPPGDGIPLEDVGYGLTSGIEILRRLRLRFPTSPAVFLTNVRDNTILSKLPLDGHTVCYSKIDMLPFEFAETVKARLG